MTRARHWLNHLDIRRLLWVGVACLLIGLFLKVSWELHEESDLDAIDRNLLVAISHLRAPAWNGIAVDVTALGSPTLITLFSLIGVALLWFNRDRRACAYLALGSLGAGLGTFALKHLFARPRPSVVPPLVEVSGSSYPSGHSLGGTSFYLLLMFLAWRHYRTWKARLVISVCTGVLIGGICFSRLYLGVHYPSDVLSGICLGAAWVFLLTSWFFYTFV